MFRLLVSSHYRVVAAKAKPYDKLKLKYRKVTGRPWKHEFTLVDPKGREVARAHFDEDEKSIHCLWIDVVPEYQRKGLATSLYLSAEKKIGKKAVPSEGLLKEGEKLWSQPNRPFGKLTGSSEIVAKKLDELLKKIATPDWKSNFIDEFVDPRDPSGKREFREKAFDERLDNLLRLIKSRAKYKNGRIVVYRCLNAPVGEFLKSKKVGDHWTFDARNVHCWEQDLKHKDLWIIVEGTISLDDVDLNETISTNMSFDHETEVTLRDGAEALIDRIVTFKDKSVLKEFDPPLKKKN